MLTILLISANVFAAVRTVPTAYPTIQSALNAGKIGDIVLVKPGIYHENIVWPQTNHLQLRGVDPEHSVIDGSGNGRVILIQGKGPDALEVEIDGLTIRNGFLGVPAHHGRKGAGLFASRAAVTLTNCVVSNNVIEGSVALQNNGGGAGIAIESTPQNHANLIAGCRISSNSIREVTTGEGSAIVIENARTDIERTTVSRNSLSVAEVAVGTVFAYASGLQLKRVIIENNSITTTEQIIPDQAAIKGGGVYAFVSGLSMVDSLIDNNLSKPFSGNERLLGAGIYYYGNPEALQILSSTITGNKRTDHARVHGTGIYFSTTGGHALNIVNSILWNPDKGPEIFNQTEPLGVSYSDVRGEYKGTLLIHSTPDFVSATDLHLQPSSPCIDAGDDSRSPTVDLKGIKRPLPLGSHVDLGCYEIDQSASQPSL